MPRYSYMTPRSRPYAYNLEYYKNYYKPMSHFIESESKAKAEKPGAQSLAERLKKFPMDGTTYPDRACSEPRFVGRFSTETEYVPAYKPTSMEEGDVKITPLHLKHPYRLPIEDEVIPPHESSIWPEGVKHFNLVKEEAPRVSPLTMHPYRLPVEDVKVPPHESSEWPESVPHFNLVSSYDLMVKFLGIGCKHC